MVQRLVVLQVWLLADDDGRLECAPALVPLHRRSPHRHLILQVCYLFTLIIVI